MSSIRLDGAETGDNLINALAALVQWLRHLLQVHYIVHFAEKIMININEVRENMSN